MAVGIVFSSEPIPLGWVSGEQASARPLAKKGSKMTELHAPAATARRPSNSCWPTRRSTPSWWPIARVWTRRDWDHVLTCYHEDAHESHGQFVGTPTDFVAWLQVNHEHVTSSMHVLSNVAIGISEEDDRLARVESYCLSHTRPGTASPCPSGSSRRPAGRIGTRTPRRTSSWRASCTWSRAASRSSPWWVTP